MERKRERERERERERDGCDRMKGHTLGLSGVGSFGLVFLLVDEFLRGVLSGFFGPEGCFCRF